MRAVERYNFVLAIVTTNRGDKLSADFFSCKKMDTKFQIEARAGYLYRVQMYFMPSGAKDGQGT